MTEETKPDERITWVRAAPGRKLVQIVEPTPTGFTVTTQWVEGEKIVRQDVEVSVVGVDMKGEAKGG